jgi:glutathione S-transferase
VDVYRGEGRTPEYLAVNPTGKIPTLVEGEFVLTESNAILEYMSEAHGGFRLFSRDPRERAAISSWLHWESAHWQPALTAVLAPRVGHELRPDLFPAPGPPDWESELLRPLFARLESRLGAHRHLAGAGLTLADLSVAGMTTYFRTAGFPFESFPGFAAWHRRLDELDAWRRTRVDPWA